MEVEVIKGMNSSDSVSPVKLTNRKRVAAYCRVSTDDEDQEKSYNSMIKYYTELIQKNSEWEFAGIYADKATTGTKTDKRYEFQRLIADCMDGKIDVVLAKSLSRFARNTMDTLKYVRMLKEKNIAVRFEVEKIDTLKDGEFLMTILSSVAQQEVENTSAYVKKGLKMKMKRGELVGFQGCMGYDYDPETKTISINEEGAEVVRYIFERYIAGAGSSIIARELNEKGLKTLRGNKWCCSTVSGILQNEKYKGDIMMGKTFTVDPISKRRVANLGEEDRFYIRNHHEPIISEEVFEKAEEMRKRRNGSKGVVPGKRERYSRQFAFSSMLECGFCGTNLSRRRWHSNTKYSTPIWQCVRQTNKGKLFCPDSKGIVEEVIEKAFVEAYRLITHDNQEVLDEFLKKVKKALSEESDKEKLAKAEKERAALEGKRKKLLQRYLDDSVEEDVYKDADRDLAMKIATVEQRIDYFENRVVNEDDLQKRLEEFKKTLSKNKTLEEFDRALFESIVEKVIVGGYDEEGNKDPYRITFIFKTGFSQSVDNTKKKFWKRNKRNSSGKTESTEMCINNSTDVVELSSINSDGAYSYFLWIIGFDCDILLFKPMIISYFRKSTGHEHIL